jgi:hypothetical protein
MKTIGLQLVTVVLENGREGVFVGIPLITEKLSEDDSQVEEIWFSDVQEIPDHMSVAKLIRLVVAQLRRCGATLQ